MHWQLHEYREGMPVSELRFTLVCSYISVFKNIYTLYLKLLLHIVTQNALVLPRKIIFNVKYEYEELSSIRGLKQ